MSFCPCFFPRISCTRMDEMEEEKSDFRVICDEVTSDLYDNDDINDEFIKMLQEMSIRDGESKDDHKERSYQTFLINLAKERNIIACLPTGSGKTFIALQLTKMYLPDAIQQKKKIVFLANTVPLVNQQAEYFRSVLSNTFLDKDTRHVECLTGDRNVDVWDIHNWKEILQNCNIMVMTTQILDDALNHDYIKWSDIIFLVLDECHHTDKDHAMNRVMTNYRNTKVKDEASAKSMPKVLGLTATIINGKKVAVENEVQEAETRLDAIAVTYHKYEEVLRHSTSAKIEFQEFCSTSAYDWSRLDGELLRSLKAFEAVLNQTNEKFLFGRDVVNELNHHSLTDNSQVYGDKNKELKKLKSIIQEILGVYTDLGPYCAKIAALNKRAFVQVQAAALFDNKYLSYFYHALDTALQSFVCKVDKLMCSHDVTDQIQRFTSQKLKSLLDILKEYGPSNKEQEKSTSSDDDLCGIVFVTKRVTAQCLAFYFQDIIEYKWKPYSFIKADFVVGSSRFDLDDSELRITTRKQNEVIQKFHAKKVNLLIATNVIEEGLNVPACNVVIRFDKILSYPSFVQSMGRARKEGSKFYAFVDEQEAAQQRNEYRKFESYNVRLSDYLRQKALHADEDYEQCDEKTKHEIEEDIPAFEPNGKGNAPRITALESISIANRYCQALPCDRLVTLAPLSWWAEVKSSSTLKKQYKAYVQFPSNSVIREVIEGEIKENKVLAKRSAFLTACIKLYELDALDDRLFPKPHKMTVTINTFMESIQIEKDEKGRKVGSTKRTQRYLKKIPDCLQETKIVPTRSFKLYQIVLEQYEATDDPISKALYQFSKRQVAYGLITPVDLSIIPQFLLDVSPTIGFLTVSFKEIILIDVKFEASEIKKLEDFERYIIGDLLELKRDIMRASQSTSILVVPLKKTIGSSREKFRIYWELVEKVNTVGETYFNVPRAEVRSEFSFTASNFEDTVLVPWYRGELRLLYTVLEIWEEHTPLSHFPYNPQWQDFRSYFLDKYKEFVDFISNVEQSLVKAKLISRNLNFFTHKATFKATKEERKDRRDKIIELVPELCIIHPMPASLYIQAKFIPSILHRMTRYLCAKEIQAYVAKNSPWPSAFIDVSKNFQEEIQDRIRQSHSRRTNKIISQPEIRQPEIKQKPEEENLNGIIAAVSNTSIGKSGECPCKSAVGVQKPLTTHIQKPANENIDAGSRTVALVQKDSLFLEFLHPGHMTHKELEQIRTRTLKKREERNRQIDKECRIDWTHERETEIELMDINKVELESLDQQFDFSRNEQPSWYKIMQAITMQGSLDYMSLERLETMGDSFLKYAVSRHVFCHFPNNDEGEMTKLRSELVSNAFLYQLGKRLKVGEYLAGGIFVPQNSWMPLTFQIPPTLAKAAAIQDLNEDIYLDENNLHELENMSSDELENFIIRKMTTSKKQVMPANTGYTYARVADKSIADSVEALIGAYYTSSGPGGALHFMEQIGLRAPTELSEKSVPLGVNWGKPEAKLLNPEKDTVEKHLPLYRELEKLICYKFNEPWLLVEAFTHPCYFANRVTQCYQRLEFLGDAVLDFLITNHIYKNDCELNPGELTDLRSALVNNVTFGSLAVRYGLHTYLLNTAKPLQDAIDVFADYQKSCGHEVTGHFKLLTDWDCPSVLVQDIDVPKVLGDIFESLAGAVYVDSGMSMDVVWKVFYRLMKNEIDVFSKSIPKSPVRELYENYPRRELFSDISVQGEKDNGLTYVALTVPVQSSTGPSHRKIFGAGSNRISAKLGAAKYAMKLLKKQNAS